MNQILALLEEDKSYCERFLKYASSRAECPFTIYTFQSYTELQHFAHQNPIDLLLTDAHVAKQGAVQTLPVRTVVELSEEAEGELPRLAGASDGPKKIYKYQSGEKILHELISNYQLEKRAQGGIQAHGNARLYLVYSPIGRSGKSMFAESLAHTLQKDMRVLFLSLEEVSARADVSMQEGNASLSDALYFFKQQRLDEARFREMISTVNGIDCILPVQSPEDMSALREDELTQFMQLLRTMVDYDAIVVDTDSMLSRVEGLLPQADWIFMPVTDQPAHQRKLSALEHYLSGSAHRTALDHIVKLVVPFDDGRTSPSTAAERLSEFTSAVVRNYIYDEPPKGTIRYNA